LEDLCIIQITRWMHQIEVVEKGCKLYYNVAPYHEVFLKESYKGSTHTINN